MGDQNKQDDAQHNRDKEKQGMPGQNKPGQSKPNDPTRPTSR